VGTKVEELEGKVVCTVFGKVAGGDGLIVISTKYLNKKKIENSL
jgi:hypothetical protein